jgi:pimeloyl-ACP methyl ester carboxylesterase
MYLKIGDDTIFAAGDMKSTGQSESVIVLLHGAGMDHTFWAYNTRYFLGKGRSVIALDFPGHGNSTGQFLETISEMADWVNLCLNMFHAESIALAGHSMGALVALELAGRAQQRVSRLALLGAGFPMTVSSPLLDAARSDSQAARDMVVLFGHGSRAYLGGNTVAGMNIMEGALRLLQRSNPGALYNDLNACNEYSNGLEAAKKVSASTTLICGEQDKMTPVSATAGILGQIDDVTRSVIPFAGHMMVSESPELTHRCLVSALLPDV